ncbi:MAG: polyribonucleotide nucleotidyltransferase [Planctomycetaceae bacterium]|nr:polyribonucleotide nucleotidyltransferase [Planctomycetaceae bacterium]
MAIVRVEREIGGRKLILETGKIAKQAQGAVWVQYGDTVVLATVLAAPASRDLDFFPLYVDYREGTYSAGKIPGGFFKREGRPTTKEILTMRLIDRPLRPLFPADYTDEVQIQCMVLSYDGEQDPDVLALIGSSAALAISPAPFDGPVGAVRIGHVNGKFVVFPTAAQLEESQMDLVLAGPAEAPNMIEMGGMEMPDDLVAEGIRLGHKVIGEIVGAIREMVGQCPVEKTYQSNPLSQELLDHVKKTYGDRIRTAKQIKGKVERNTAVSAIKDEAVAALCPEGQAEPKYTPAEVGLAVYKVEGKIQRELILNAIRPDGRGVDEIRPLQIEVGVLPRTHGSSIFARGETQALVTATLGTPRDQVIIDGIMDEYKKGFYLHYNFPPFSVGQIKPIRGPGRREIGHGMLAEKSIEPVMPGTDEFPYTVRVVADIMESNGSTSQAACCGATMALMDAGVPIKAPVAGISIGMVSDENRYILLTDIIGEEDFHGDMDFKVAGTAEGITGIQLDMKARGIPVERMDEVLAQARKARLFLLAEMAKVLPAPRSEISQYAPRMLTLKIDPELIGKVIGPGGKMIKSIQEESGATIDIEDDGSVFISCVDAEGAQKAKEAVEGLTASVEVGKIYKGTVVTIRDFGAFIEILPGQDGLCHVSELDDKYVKKVDEVCKVGDVLQVKVIGIDDQGRVKLSRKAAMKELGEGAK